MKIQLAAMSKRNRQLFRHLHRRHHQLQQVNANRDTFGREHIFLKNELSILTEECLLRHPIRASSQGREKAADEGQAKPLGRIATTKAKVCTAGGGLQLDHHEFVGKFLTFSHWDLNGNNPPSRTTFFTLGI